MALSVGFISLVILRWCDPS